MLYQLKLTFCLLLLSRENSDGLSCIENQPMTELCYVDIGLGYQSVRLEFDTMCSSYSFLIRDEERCKSFISLITGSWFGYTVYDIVSLNQHWVGCFMSFRHVHESTCKRVYFFFKWFYQMQNLKNNAYPVCMFVVIEWEYNLILPVLFSIYRKQIQNCILWKKL